jgi:hypothetical protein
MRCLAGTTKTTPQGFAVIGVAPLEPMRIAASPRWLLLACKLHDTRRPLIKSHASFYFEVPKTFRSS